jgi:hypothetical protein
MLALVKMLESCISMIYLLFPLDGRPSGIGKLLQAVVLLRATEPKKFPGWAVIWDSSVAVDQAVLTVRIISWMGSYLG